MKKKMRHSVTKRTTNSRGPERVQSQRKSTNYSRRKIIKLSRRSPIVVDCGVKREEVLSLIASAADFRRNAVRDLYQCQTVAERRGRATYLRNRVGFDAGDAKRLTAIAEASLEREITPEEDDILRAHLPKYARQLSRMRETFNAQN